VVPEGNQTNLSEDSAIDGNEMAQDSESSESKMNIAVVVAIIGLVIIFIAAARLFVMKNGQENGVWDSLPSMDAFDSPTLPQMTDLDPQIQQVPPLPATGLPEGWTMEQWEHYGQQYLDQMAGHNNG
jgi:hypothetical protein